MTMTLRSILRPCVAILGMVAVLAVATPARAHKVVASAYASGDRLEGEVGFSNGDMAKDVSVRVSAPDGRLLGTTTTDGDGFFSYMPTEAVDHVFEADLGAGHVARFTVSVADLPKALSQGGAATPSTTAPSVEPGASASTALPADLAALVAEAVREEVRPLRREIAAYKEAHDFQTILGGIGYILGLMGVVYFLMARRRLQGTR
jgi:nickel transport protein